MIILPQSGVSLDRERHTYSYHGIELSGITGLIRERLFGDEYKNVPASVLAAAAREGSAFHEAIEAFDRDGATPTFEAMGEHPLLRGVFEYEALKNKEGFATIANEYIVTDYRYWASPIDVVFTSEGGIVLADVKTTYMLNPEYVSWQLSVYAYLFERQTEYKVSRLCALHFRKKSGRFVNCAVVDIDRKSDEEVSELLYGYAASGGTSSILTAIATKMIAAHNTSASWTEKEEGLKKELCRVLLTCGTENFEYGGITCSLTKRKPQQLKVSWEAKTE